uniref:exosome RNA helicase MTR4-like n=1 Tax=Gasterosteus aculeatus aculeatus TaxID=481459 RepID=UPI001A99CE71
MADAFGDSLFSVFDDEQQTTASKKTPASLTPEIEKVENKNDTDMDTAPSGPNKREADSDGGEEMGFSKKPRHDTISELNLSEVMPQVKVEQVETVE